ncbi:Mu transposase C-terminal domain-containing protein [Streptomyces kronopolitis]
MFTLKDDGCLRKLTSHGVRWRGRTYIAPWRTGQAGRTVTVRYMPHHDHEIDICDASGGYLGPAHLADAATPEQLEALRTARAERARRLRAEVKAAETLRRQRFAPATTAGPAQRLGTSPPALQTSTSCPSCRTRPGSAGSTSVCTRRCLNCAGCSRMPWSWAGVCRAGRERPT